MTVYNVTKAALSANVVTLTLDSISGLRVGYKANVQGVDTPAQPHFDGVHTLTAVTTTVVNAVNVYTIQYAKNHANIAQYDCAGFVRIICEWIDAADVEDWLGVAPATQADEDYLASCVDAANQWAYDRRQAAGYHKDLANVVPTDSVRLGTVMYAASQYRERASVDSFSSFQDLGTTAPVGSIGSILRLLGCNKPQVA